MEAELEKARVPVEKEHVDPFARRTAKKAPEKTAPVEPEPDAPKPKSTTTPKPNLPPPLPKPVEAFPASLVRKLGSAEDREHRRWQHQLMVVGQQRGWRNQKEAPLGEHGNADVLLTKNNFRIACEVALTSPPEYEVASISKRLAAGMTHVLVVSTNEEHLARIEKLARKSFGKAVGDTICFGTPDFVGGFLDELDASLSGGEEVIGEMHVRYQAKVVTPEDQHLRSGRLNTALKRLKGGGKRSRS